MEPTVYLRLLGSPQVETADGHRVALERRVAGLLAYLAFEGETSRTRLIELLWPDVEPDDARNSLRQRLFQLKKRCGVDLVRGADVLTLGEALTTDVAGTLTRGTGAPLLDGCDFSECSDFLEWLVGQRERLAGSARAELAARAEAAERQGQLAAALAAAAELVALEPLQEHAHRRVMRLHYLRGDRAAGLAAFERCERVLKDELSVRPGAETLELLRTIESSAPLAARPDATHRLPIPASVQRPPRLIGRAQELQAIGRAWDAGRHVLLLGEGGVGKSRVLAEALAGQAGPVHVKARPGDAGMPYASLARLLRALIEAAPAALDAAPRAEIARVLPEVGEVAPGASDRQRPALQRAIDAVVHAAAGRGVSAIGVDDLHYADDASLEAWATLALSVHGGGLRWLFARRRDEGGEAARRLHDTLLDARRLEVVALPTLDERQLVELVDSLAIAGLAGEHVAPLLMRHTGGNPLYALETIKQMRLAGSTAADLPRPASVGQLIERRLRQLSPRATALARVAAVAGVDFSVGVAEAVTGVSALELADAWQELEAAQVLRGNAFAHDLVYESALATLPQTIASHLHQAIATWQESHGGVPARIAFHYTSAGQPALAADHWMACAHTAKAALRFVEATDAFERAAFGYAAGGRPGHAFDAAYAMRLASFEVDLAERSGAALDLLERFAATPFQRARARNERAVTRLHQGDLAGTEESARAGLQELAAADEPILRAELRRNLAATFAWRNESHAALNELRAIRDDVERHGTPEQRSEFWGSLAIVLEHVDQCDEAQRTHRKAIDAAVAIGNLPSAAQSALNAAVGLHDSGRLRDALAMLESARGMLAAVHAERPSYSSLNLNYGYVLRGLGEYTDGLAQLELAIANARVQTPGWLPLATANRAHLWLQLGQFARAHQDLDAAVPDAQSPMQARAKWACVHAALARALGRRDAGELQALIAAQPSGGRRMSRWRLQRESLEHADDADAVQRGRLLLDEVVQAGRMGLAISIGAAIAPRLAALGHIEEACSLARQALGWLREHDPDDAYRGDVWWSCHRVLRTVGSPSGDAQRPAADVPFDLMQAAQWVRDTARLRVPEEFRDSFLNRNVSNRELLRASGQPPSPA